MTEQLKPIPGYENYLISKKGEIFSLKSNRYLKAQINTGGYLYFSFSENNIRKNFLLSRLLAFVFLNLPSLDSTLEVDHEDNDKLNNSLSNLKVMTKPDHVIKTVTVDKKLKIRKIRTCKRCSKMIPHNNVSGYCGHCYSQPLVNNAITVKDIEYWVINFSWTRASKELGLSDNGLRKRYTKLTGKSPKEIRPEYEC